MKWVFIASGGALGSIARYGLQGLIQRMTGFTFPLGTMVVNITGCLVVGMLYALVNGPWPLREELRLGLIVGVLGGFTTFSAFGLETFLMAHEGHTRWAVLNVAASCALGLVAVWLGYRLTTSWFGAPPPVP